VGAARLVAGARAAVVDAGVADQGLQDLGDLAGGVVGRHRQSLRERARLPAAGRIRSMAATDPTTVWRIRPGVVLALASRLGTPTDAYVNGSQVWLTPGAVTLEWRLHPSAAYRLPDGLSPHELWDQVVAQLVTGAEAGV